MKLVSATAALAAVMAAAQGASAQSHPAHTNPDWLRVPTAEELGEARPLEAARKHIDGFAHLKCEVDLQGLVQNCTVTSETPPGMGFGPAALALTPKFLFRPATQDGKPVTSWVNIPVHFSGETSKGPARPRTGTLISGGAADEPTGERFYLLPNVPWDKAPSAAQLAAAYPRQAKPGAVGHVVLACRFSKTGDPKGCTTDVETPAGQAFSAAAKSLLPFFHLDPATAEGIDVTKIHVNLAVHFTPPGAETSRVIDHPEWLSAADPGADLFPKKAAEAGLKTGRAVLNCVADVDGRMVSCQVVSEDPAGMDFGPAAVKTASSVRINRWGVNGEPAEGAHVTFAVRVNKDEPDAPPKP